MPVFEMDYEYSDTRGEANQFYRWLKFPGTPLRGIKNSGGIRRIYRRDKKDGLAALVLISHEAKGPNANPWDDSVDRTTSAIRYWGDAKSVSGKECEDFPGNRTLAAIWRAMDGANWGGVPPILHFTKPRVGIVRFTGVCVISELAEAWLLDDDRRVRNYRFNLDILPIRSVNTAWIEARVESRDESSVEPRAWRTFRTTGKYVRWDVYAKEILDQQAQSPSPGTADASILAALKTIDPAEFELLVLKLWKQHAHDVSGTPLRRDGGFDFFGRYRLPPPLSYDVAFKGEVKRYQSGVGPRHVARLVARLGRGEHGVFVTTSHFTRDCQREILADGYPVQLIHGRRLVELLRATPGAIQGGRLSPDWLEDS